MRGFLLLFLGLGALLLIDGAIHLTNPDRAWKMTRSGRRGLAKPRTWRYQSMVQGLLRVGVGVFFVYSYLSFG